MEKKRSSKKWVLIILFILIGIVLAACGGGKSDPPSLPKGTYPVDVVFQDFYNQHGGVDLFGYAISTAYTTVQGEKGQYFETVLMLYNSNTGAIYFGSIGKDLNLGELPVSAWAGPTAGGIYVGSNFIHPAFASLYLTLGPDLVGAPLTDPTINISQNRIEQHFENLGMYLNLEDPAPKASLLFYGRLHCLACNYQNPLTQDAVVKPLLINAAITQQLKELGVNASLLGNPVEGPVDRYDGAQDYIYEYLVLQETDGILKVQDVPVQLGLSEGRLYYPVNDSNFVFIEILDGGGHNVFHLFDDFIRAHGGYQVSGNPISSLTRLDAATNVLRQCFENYCLDFVPDAPGQSVRPVPLGKIFFEKFSEEYRQPKFGVESGGQGAGDGTAPPRIVERNLSPFTLIAGETHPNVDSQTTQVLFFWVKLQQTPQPGMELELTISYPDGHDEVVTLEPTDENGYTSYTLAPIPGENGNLVRYEACLNYGDLPPVCVEQVFMIWGNP